MATDPFDGFDPFSGFDPGKKSEPDAFAGFDPFAGFNPTATATDTELKPPSNELMQGLIGVENPDARVEAAQYPEANTPIGTGSVDTRAFAGFNPKTAEPVEKSTPEKSAPGLGVKITEPVESPTLLKTKQAGFLKRTGVAKAILEEQNVLEEPKVEPVGIKKAALAREQEEPQAALATKSAEQLAEEDRIFKKKLEPFWTKAIEAFKAGDKMAALPLAINAAKKNGASPDDIKKVAEERQNKLAAYDVTQSSKYQNEVAAPLDRILKELQDASKDFGYPWKDFVDAVEQPTKREREAALSKVLATAEKELNPLTTLDILSGVNEYLQRQEFGDALIKNAKVAQEAMKREEAAKGEQSKKQSETEFSRISGIVFDHIVSDETLESMPFLKGEDGCFECHSSGAPG